jgi:large subunit ribosomal protein L5
MLKNFKELYSISVPELFQECGCKNQHQVPKILKVVLNMGCGEATKNSKIISAASNDLALISGQKPIITLAKKSIASFSLRQGMKIGCKVTLRRNKMYEFLERLIITALPRVKEFKGFSKKNFDKAGNLNFGLPEQIVFPEIHYDKIDTIRGLNISIVTSTDNDMHAKKLLEKLYFPFYD